MVEERDRIKVYFSHPKSTYGTQQEAQALAILKREFPEPDHLIINPADEKHRLHAHDERYFRALIADCSGLSFLAFDDGKIPHDVSLDVDHFNDKVPQGGVSEVSLAQNTILDGELDDRRLLSQALTEIRYAQTAKREK